MNKNELKYYTISFVLLIILAIVEYSKPRPVDWRQTYDYSHKIPYGAYIFRNTLDEIFPNGNIEENKNTVYEYYNSNIKKKRNYIFLTFNLEVDVNEVNTLFKLVEEGNNVFIAAEYISDTLASLLNIDYTNILVDYIKYDSIIFTNDNFKQKQFSFITDKIDFNSLTKFDTANATVLAHTVKNKAVFIKQSINEGNFFLFFAPQVFTNYSMVTLKNYRAAFNALSYMPDFDVVLCNYYKPYKTENTSVFKYIFQNPSLRHAFNVFMYSFLIYFLLHLKRRQRIIPVLTAHRNTTLDFAYTLGRLYYKSKNNKDIILKKFNYFNEFLISKYYLSFFETELLDCQKIAEKTGVPINTVEALCAAQRNIKNEKNISDEQLLALNKHFEDFYNNAQ